MRQMRVAGVGQKLGDQGKKPRGVKRNFDVAVLVRDVALVIAKGQRSKALKLLDGLAAGFDDSRAKDKEKRCNELDPYVRAVLKVLGQPHKQSVRRQAKAAIDLLTREN